MTNTIYDICIEYLNLLSMIEENEGEITPEIEEALSLNEYNWEDKMEAYAKIIANYEAQAEARRKEAERLTKAARTAEKTADTVRNTILFFMNHTGRKKEEIGLFRFCIRETTAVNIVDESLLEDTYKIYKVQPNKVAIKDAIKGGKYVAGAELVKRTSLTIK